MLAPPRPCSVCGRPVLRAGRCEVHCRQSERRRGSSSQRGYGVRHRRVFRAAVLDRDPVCVLCGVRPSVVADHFPLSRRQLVSRGLDADDPGYGRGLCESCHNGYTSSLTCL